MTNELPLQLDQLEYWQQSLEEGRSLIEGADQLLNEAKQAQLLRRWQDAVNKFQLARARYDAARLKLIVPAAVDASSYRALQLLRDEAAAMLEQSRAALAEFERARWIETCERNIVIAADVQQQAQAALYSGNYNTARTLATQASQIHPGLREESERTMRSALDLAREHSGVVSTVLTILFLVVLLAIWLSSGSGLPSF